MVPKVPGERALAFASRWFEPAIVHRTFEPLIADWQREWYESEPSRRPWVSIRAAAAFICAAVISSPGIIALPTPRSISLQVARRIALFCLVIGGALSIPMVRSMEARSLEAPWWGAMLLMVMPAALSITFPFAMIIAVDAIRRHADVPSHVARAAALKLGVIAICLMQAAGGFVGPLANRKWTELSTPAGWNIPQRRPQQLSTVALLRHPERNTAIVPAPQYTRADEIRRELINRSVLSVMPAMFVWLRWTALSHPRRRRFWPLPASAMTALVVVLFFASFFSGFRLEIELGMAPGSGLMLPLVVFGLWTLAEQRLAQRAKAA